MANTTIVFGAGETQFAPVPDEHGHTFRVTGINPDGARIITASVALESASEMREMLWARSGTGVAREVWHEDRAAVHARTAAALVAFHRPTRADAAANASAWLALLEAATQTPVERLIRATHAFEVRVAPVLEVVVERGTVRVGAYSAPAPPTLAAALAAAAEALGTDVSGLCAAYALRRIAHRADDDGAVVSCADAPDVLRAKRRRTIELHEHAECATCHRAIRNTAERSAEPPRFFFPRLVVCNVCPLGREFALWNGTRMEYESHSSSLRVGTGRGRGAATTSEPSAEPNAVRAAREVMIAVLLAIERAASAPLASAPLAAQTQLAASVRTVPSALLRTGFESLLAPFDASP